MPCVLLTYIDKGLDSTQTEGTWIQTCCANIWGSQVNYLHIIKLMNIVPGLFRFLYNGLEMYVRTRNRPTYLILERKTVGLRLSQHRISKKLLPGLINMWRKKIVHRSIDLLLLDFYWNYCIAYKFYLCKFSQYFIKIKFINFLMKFYWTKYYIFTNFGLLWMCLC